jgi:hypothetical protein
MRIRSIVVLVASLLWLAACSPSQKITGSWVNREALKKKYTSLFIVVLTGDQVAKNIFELDLASAASSKRGLKVFTSSQFLAPGFTKKKVDKETILARAKELGCDAILTVALVDAQSETKFVQNPNASYYGYAPYAGYGYGFSGYYSYMGGPGASNPGHDEIHWKYFVEANVFDLATQALIWSVQSEAYDPGSIPEASNEYSQLLLDRVEEDLGPKK